MFGDLLGSFERKQEEMLAKSAEIIVEARVGGIKVTANGQNKIVNITIEDPSVLSDKEQLEDLLMVAINRALTEAGEKTAEQMQSVMSDMLPGGLGSLSGLFGK